MNINSRRGFTLIELLVVIAIIGILASIILASLSTARSKSVDTSVRAHLNSVRSQMEVYNTSVIPNGYNSGCSTGNPNGALTILAALASQISPWISGGVTSQNDAIGAYNKVTCNDNQGKWAADSPLSNSTSGSPKMWCVDSSGNSKAEATALATATTYQCS